jgi:radical SAM protein with 4Fe4S-binding SPASM domain
MSFVDHRTRSHLSPALPHLDVELTERCNNACLHCYINRPAADAVAMGRELSTAQWIDLFRQAANLGALNLRFTGGEPLLRPDFAELYLAARRLGLKVQLFTNARLVTPELAALFQRVPPLVKVEVTVYGMSAASYDAAACSPGAYEQFRGGLDLLLAHGTPLTVKWAVLPPNEHEVSQYERWAASLPGAEGPAPVAMVYDLRARRDSQSRNALIASLRRDPQEVAAHLARDEQHYRQEMSQFCARFTRPAGDQLFSCGAGHTLSIDAYGRIQGCLLLRAPHLSLQAGSDPGALAQALRELPARLGALKATHPAYLARCARCFLRGLCESCPAKSWMEHGVLDAPVEYHCQIAHAQARRLGLLAPGEQAWQVADWQSRLANLSAQEMVS